MDIETIKAVIVNYRKSKIQSEAEVSSKLIVPLFQALGYSDELMAQEFPVYGYAGRQELTAKNADFLFFCPGSFSYSSISRLQYTGIFAVFNPQFAKSILSS